MTEQLTQILLSAMVLLSSGSLLGTAAVYYKLGKLETAVNGTKNRVTRNEEEIKGIQDRERINAQRSR